MMFKSIIVLNYKKIATKRVSKGKSFWRNTRAKAREMGRWTKGSNDGIGFILYSLDIRMLACKSIFDLYK
jgi:hypothetical protein